MHGWWAQGGPSSSDLYPFAVEATNNVHPFYEPQIESHPFLVNEFSIVYSF